MTISQKDFADLKEIYLKDTTAKNNITKTVKKFCNNKKIPYSDSLRRKGSKVLKRGFGGHTPSADAKILLFDLETSPIIFYGWNLYPKYIPHDDIIQDWKLLCFSAKWLFEEEVIHFKLTEEELKNFDDSRITNELWKLLDEATVTISHNGKNFDLRKSNAKFIEHGLPLPSSSHVIDTLYHARKKLSMTSNRLDYLGKFFGFGGKVETPKDMWREVMSGNYDMLKMMSEYCDGDVKLLEDIYLEMRPFIQPHPNVGLHITHDAPCCPSCGSTDLENLEKPYATTVNLYEMYRCKSCSSLSRNRTPLKTDKETILSSVPQ